MHEGEGDGDANSAVYAGADKTILTLVILVMTPCARGLATCAWAPAAAYLLKDRARLRTELTAALDASCGYGKGRWAFAVFMNSMRRDRWLVYVATARPGMQRLVDARLERRPCRSLVIVPTQEPTKSASMGCAPAKTRV